MSQLFVEVYRFTDKGEAEVPVQSAVCLFLLNYLQYPPDLSVFLVLSKPKAPSLVVCIETLQYSTIEPTLLQHPVSDCFLPVFATAGTSSCVAGLCSVLRQVSTVFYFWILQCKFWFCYFVVVVIKIFIYHIYF